LYAKKISKISYEKDISASNYYKVVVIGLGQLGLPVAKYVKEHGFDTFGYDLSEKALQRAESLYGIKRATTFNDFDVLIICVSTHIPHDIFSPQIEGLMSVVEKINREAKTGALISIESTIPKGTSKKVFEKLDHRLHVVHAPHRWYALEEDVHGVNQVRVIGGVSNCCLQHGLNFYDGRSISSSKNIVNNNNNNNNNNHKNSKGNRNPNIDDSLSSVPSNNDNNKEGNRTNVTITTTTTTTTTTKSSLSLLIPMQPVSSVETAELTKIIENAHRYLQIAFAEELYLYCKSNGINFAELRNALNTKWNVDILEPRDGIGGHCLPKDTKMFINSSNTIKSKILQAAMEIDEDYKEYIQSREKGLKKPIINKEASHP
jgi:UDP-N-acetyl-D-mannosaminuronate dehydrogenase